MDAASASLSVSPLADASSEAEPPRSLSLRIVAEAGDWSGISPLLGIVRESARVVAGHPRCTEAQGKEASIVLADDAFLRSLNRTYRSEDAPTNVLSFPFKSSPGEYGSGYLGDIVLAAETIAREAAEQNIPPRHHFQHLIVHGVLHLLGFDHGTEAEAAVMESIEVEILAGLGVADPYSVSESST